MTDSSCAASTPVLRGSIRSGGLRRMLRFYAKPLMIYGAVPGILAVIGPILNPQPIMMSALFVILPQTIYLAVTCYVLFLQGVAREYEDYLSSLPTGRVELFEARYLIGLVIGILPLLIAAILVATGARTWALEYFWKITWYQPFTMSYLLDLLLMAAWQTVAFNIAIGIITLRPADQIIVQGYRGPQVMAAGSQLLPMLIMFCPIIATIMLCPASRSGSLLVALATFLFYPLWKHRVDARVTTEFAPRISHEDPLAGASIREKNMVKIGSALAKFWFLYIIWHAVIRPSTFHSLRHPLIVIFCMLAAFIAPIFLLRPFSVWNIASWSGLSCEARRKLTVKLTLLPWLKMLRSLPASGTPVICGSCHQKILNGFPACPHCAVPTAFNLETIRLSSLGQIMGALLFLAMFLSYTVWIGLNGQRHLDPQYAIELRGHAASLDINAHRVTTFPARLDGLLLADQPSVPFSSNFGRSLSDTQFQISGSPLRDARHAIGSSDEFRYIGEWYDEAPEIQNSIIFMASPEYLRSCEDELLRLYRQHNTSDAVFRSGEAADQPLGLLYLSSLLRQPYGARYVQIQVGDSLPIWIDGKWLTELLKRSALDMMDGSSSAERVAFLDRYARYLDEHEPGTGRNDHALFALAEACLKLEPDYWRSIIEEVNEHPFSFTADNMLGPDWYARLPNYSAAIPPGSIVSILIRKEHTWAFFFEDLFSRRHNAAGKYQSFADNPVALERLKRGLIKAPYFGGMSSPDLARIFRKLDAMDSGFVNEIAARVGLESWRLRTRAPSTAQVTVDLSVLALTGRPDHLREAITWAVETDPRIHLGSVIDLALVVHDAGVIWHEVEMALPSISDTILIATLTPYTPTPAAFQLGAAIMVADKSDTKLNLWIQMHFASAAHYHWSDLDLKSSWDPWYLTLSRDHQLFALKVALSYQSEFGRDHIKRVSNEPRDHLSDKDVKTLLAKYHFTQ